MDTMTSNSNEIRSILKFYFLLGRTVAHALNDIHRVYGRDAMDSREAHEWFGRFHEGIFDIKTTPGHRIWKPTIPSVNEDGSVRRRGTLVLTTTITSNALYGPHLAARVEERKNKKSTQV